MPSLAAVYRAQLSRARVARIPLLFVATFQSVGIMILMRGWSTAAAEARAVVAGSSVLVVAFVALNLLAQYFGQLRASGGLDHYATLPVPPAAVVLGAAGAYASFTVPGTRRHRGHRLRAVRAAADPPVGAGRGDPARRGRARRARAPRSGCSRPRQELATLLGPAGHVRGAAAGGAAGRTGCRGRSGAPGTCCPPRTASRPSPGPSAPHPDWAAVAARPRACARRSGCVSLAVATWAYRRAAVR